MQSDLFFKSKRNFEDIYGSIESILIFCFLVLLHVMIQGAFR